MIYLMSASVNLDTKEDAQRAIGYFTWLGRHGKIDAIANCGRHGIEQAVNEWARAGDIPVHVFPREQGDLSDFRPRNRRMFEIAKGQVAGALIFAVKGYPNLHLMDVLDLAWCHNIDCQTVWVR